MGGFALVRDVVSVVALFMPLRARGDLPVHCVRHQVAGDWEFTLGPEGPQRSSCGHRNPDDQYKQPPLSFVSSLGASTSLKVSLQQPDTLQAEDGSSGTWTMIYDEGFEMAIGEMVYFAFSNFEYFESTKTNISHCDATQVGWYHNKARTRWGCYEGRKKGAQQDPSAQAAPPKQVSVAAMSALQRFLLPTVDQPAAEDDSAQSTVGQPATESDSAQSTVPEGTVPEGSAGFDNPMPDQFQQSVADSLNFMQLGWTASAYANFQGKSPRELNHYAGVRRNRIMPKKKLAAAPSSPFFTSFLGLRSTVEHRSGHSFDWRKHKGKNWLTPVVEQGDCGSCYTIATVHMLTARNRIEQNDPAEPSFSVSFPLYCSEYNQGCDGGYGFLQTKWSEDVGLIPDTCAPFSQGGGSCHKVLTNCNFGVKRYRAMNHHYVGGYYGGSDADNIKKELVANGPMVMSFEPKEDFMYYKDGVYKSGAQKIHQEWQQVDHAVLLVGLGAHKGEKYWTMQNSWGTDWGEEGYFRMARGIDESACESIVVAASVAREESNSVLDAFITAL